MSVNISQKYVEKEQAKKNYKTKRHSIFKLLDMSGKFLIYIIGILWLVPLLWLITTAFKPSELATTFSLTFNFTLENFKNVLETAPFGTYYINTFIIVFLNLIVQIITSTLAAYAFARLEFKGKNILFIFVLLQLMIPNDVLIFPNYQTLSQLRLVNTKLGVVLPYFGSAFGIFLLRQAFKTIPYELEEAATLDGCSLLQVIWNVYVPLAKPIYVAFGLISVSYHWNNFLWPLIVTNSVEQRPLTVGLAVFAKSFETGAMWSQVTAATFMVVAPLIIAFFIFQKQFISSFIDSAIK